MTTPDNINRAFQCLLMHCVHDVHPIYGRGSKLNLTVHNTYHNSSMQTTVTIALFLSCLWWEE